MSGRRSAIKGIFDIDEKFSGAVMSSAGIVTLTWSRRKIGFGFMIRHSGQQLSNR